MKELKEFKAEDNKGLEFEVGNFTAVVDIHGVEGDTIYYTITDLHLDNYYQELDFNPAELYDSISDYCIEAGYIADPSDGYLVAAGEVPV